MKYLLDTHAVIWFITDDKKLPGSIKRLIEDFNNDCIVSSASLWEIAIKYSLGRLELNSDLEEIFKIILKSPLEVLLISNDHILEVSKLPYHHRDPFDRLIIAQGRFEQTKIITKDSSFNGYEIEAVWETIEN